MRKTISIPNDTNQRLKEVAKAQGTTHSGIIQTALTMYFMLHYVEPDKLKALNNVVPKGQTDIFNILKERSTHKK